MELQIRPNDMKTDISLTEGITSDNALVSSKELKEIVRRRIMKHIELSETITDSAISESAKSRI